MQVPTAERERAASDMHHGVDFAGCPSRGANASVASATDGSGVMSQPTRDSSGSTPQTEDLVAVEVTRVVQHGPGPGQAQIVCGTSMEAGTGAPPAEVTWDG